MPTDAFEDTLDLRIGLLEAVAPASPYPLLRPTGQIETRTFSTVVLENAYLRVTIVPGLGGRILSILDKRTNTEILEPADLTPREGGSRGATIRAGIAVVLDGGERPNDLGPVDYEIEEPPEAVWIAESAGGTGLSFHLRIELPPERAELQIETRVLNRTKRPLPYNGGLAFQVGEVFVDGHTLYAPSRKAGLKLCTADLLQGFSRPGGLTFTRFGQIGTIGPRQVDSWEATIRPFSGLNGSPFVGEDLATFLSDDLLEIQSSEPIPGARLLLGLADSQTVEASADLYPEHVVEIPLEGLAARPVALAVQDADRHDRLRADRIEPQPLPQAPAAPPAAPDPNVASLPSKGWLKHMGFSVAYRAIVQLEMGHRALAEGEYEKADEHLETALLYNGDDPLNWWTKAMARRLAGAEGESPELLNAHYLAPLEPALRAEAFLTQSQNQGREPNPLVAPLAGKPEALIEVAALLLEIGVRAEASRWIDEAVRHRDLPMLRYLAAWSLLQGSRMEAEAAVQVAAAARLPFEPPYPWREIERTALRDLRERFPNDERLRQYASL
ncbi:DUF5107 domain-containing protein [bacterium]|nr:MAG: DUF5107 domain-containing protein [bacterium]